MGGTALQHSSRQHVTGTHHTGVVKVREEVAIDEDIEVREGLVLISCDDMC